jgi:hypothetical protein
MENSTKQYTGITVKWEQNCKAYFESSIWHPTKAQGVTQKGHS